MKKLLILFFIVAFNQIHAEYVFDFNDSCIDAYQNILKLKFVAAKSILEKEQQKNPENLIPDFLYNYIDILTIFFNDNYQEYQRLQKNKDIRINRLSKGPTDSPYYLYSQAEINIQWATIRMRMGEYYSAFWEFRKGYFMLNENQKKFSDFIANKKNLGLIHAMVGTIPDQYKWGVKILGFSGTIEQGAQELKEIISYSKKNNFIFRDESIMSYSYLLLHLKNDKENAWNIVQSNLLTTQDNLLNTFVCSNIAAQTGNNDEAIRLLLNRPQNNGYASFPIYDYFLGIYKLNRLDDNSSIYLEKFLNNYSGQNYVKDGYLKLSWFYIIQNDTQLYKKNIGKCINSGSTNFETDKQALKEAQKNKIPNHTLLKSRLLSDGGYYLRAIFFLGGKNTSDFEDIKDKIEFSYRAGRIYDDWGMPEKAIGYYFITIKNGEKHPFYYAANSALKIGNIYEKKGEYKKAKEYYEKCLAINSEEYKNSIHQKAKAGLNRIEDQ